ncbi:hypothetical protein AXL65_02500 [Salmonella enterica subsp. enterica]|nr:hypothetical protein [Salmonella enterica subsp. enterica]
MNRQDAIAQAQKELEALNQMPESIQPLLEFARQSLLAVIEGRPVRVLHWRRLVGMMMEQRPRVVYCMMKQDKGVSRAIYVNGEYCDPVVTASSWDTPCISFDYQEPFECFLEVEDSDHPLNCPTWPQIMITRLKGAGVKMIPMK